MLRGRGAAVVLLGGRPPARPGDLAGLLCGPGRAELFGRGSLARLIVSWARRRSRSPTGSRTRTRTPTPSTPTPEEPGPSTSVGATLTSNVRIATSSPARHAAPGDGADEDDDQAPDVDLDDLAFLDLDPDEMAARLGLTAATPAPGPEPPDRDGGFPDVERQHGPHAGTDPPDPTLTWRAHAVRCALRARGVPAETRAHRGRAPRVRTAFRADLVDLARAWTAGDGMKKVPAEFELDGPRLRLWVLAAGWHDGRAYSLGLDPGTAAPTAIAHGESSPGSGRVTPPAGPPDRRRPPAAASGRARRTATRRSDRRRLARVRPATPRPGGSTRPLCRGDSDPDHAVPTRVRT